MNKIKTYNTILSEQFQNPIEKSSKRAISKPGAHIYMTIHFPGLVQALQ